jgi:hypothetical protein
LLGAFDASDYIVRRKSAGSSSDATNDALCDTTVTEPTALAIEVMSALLCRDLNRAVQSLLRSCKL